MKKQTLTLFAVLSLLLAGCQKNENSVSNKGNSQDVSSGISETVNPTEKPTEQPTENPSATAKPSASASEEKPSTSEKPSVSTSSSVEEKSKWGADVQAQRKQYLGGEILPYVSLGKSVTAAWSRPGTYDKERYLEITGTAAYSQSLANDFQAAFTKDGYTVLGTGEKTATNDEKHLSVVLKEDEDSGVAVIQASYDEPYDKTKFLSWNDETREIFNDNLHQHGSSIPLIYLGSCNPDSEWNDYKGDHGAVVLTGFKWDDRVFADTKATLDGAGWTTSESTDTKTVGSLKLSDNCVITISIEKDGSSYFGYKPEATISIVEGYNPGTATAWSTDVKDELEGFLGQGHVPPYVYLGRDGDPTVDTNNYDHSIVLKGGQWHDEIINDVKTTYTNDGWTLVKDNSAEAISKDKTILLLSKSYDDGNVTIKAELTSGYKGVPTLRFYYREKFDPTACSSWNTDVSDIIDTERNQDTIPYVYLGLKEPVATYYKSSGLTVYGGEWNDQVIDLAKAAFLTEGSGWVKDSEDTASEKPSIHFHRWFDNGDYRFVTIEKYSDYARLYAHIRKTTTDSKAWSNEAKTLRNSVLDNHSVPYFYRAPNSDITATQSGNQVILSAASKDLITNDIMDAYKAIYVNDGWTIKEKTTPSGYERTQYDIIAKKTEEDGCILTAVLGTTAHEYDYEESTFDAGTFTVTIDVPYDPSKGTAWSTEVKNARKDSLGRHDDIPYFYMGYPEATISEKTSDTLVLKGAAYDAQMLTEFKAAFEKNSAYMVQTDATACKGSATATRTSGVSGTRNAVLSKGSDGNAYLNLKFTESYNAKNRTSYSDDVKAQIKKIFGDNELPSLYLGTVNPTVTLPKNSSYLDLNGTKWNDSILKDNKPILENAGFTVIENKEGSNGHFAGVSSAAALQGYKYLGSDAKSGRIRFLLTRDNADKSVAKATARFWYDASFTDSNATATSNWTTDAANKKTREDNLGGTVLPYFYAGTSVDVSSSSYYKNQVKITGDFSGNDKNSAAIYFNIVDTLVSNGGTLKYVDYTYGEYGGKVTILYPAKDGNVIEITRSSYSSDLYITCQYKEAFNPSNAQTDWSDDVKNKRTRNFGHVLPYFYIGAKDPVANVSSYYGFTITGATFDTRVFGYCEEALKKDTTLTWKIVNDNETLLFAKAVDADGNTYYVTLQEDSKSQTVRTLKRVKKATSDTEKDA